MFVASTEKSLGIGYTGNLDEFNSEPTQTYWIACIVSTNHEIWLVDDKKDIG